MITLIEGSETMLPYVQVEITTGRFPFQYWYEVSFYDPTNEIDGKICPCWVHDYEKDGGGFGLWFVVRKANEALQNCWFELLDKKTPTKISFNTNSLDSGTQTIII